MRDLLILNAAQLVTPGRGSRRGSEMRELRVVSDGALLVRNGRIVAVGTTEALRADAPGDVEVIDAAGQVVLPGFVDAHTHPVFGGNRVDEFGMRASGATYQEIAAAGGGIRSTVEKTRAASFEELLEAGRRYASWFLSNGTTTLEAKSGYGLTVEDELKLLRVIRHLGQETGLGYIPTFLGAHAFPPELAHDKPACVARVADEMLPIVAREGLARYCDIFVEERYYEPAMARHILSSAKAHGLKLRMHVDQLCNGGGAELAAELGASTADHLEHTDEKGIAALVAAGVTPVLLPASVYCLGLLKYPIARLMIEAGLPVVLATDFNPGSSPTPSMPFVLSLACTQMKMSPEEALTAATANAAASLDLAEEVGAIEVGMRADFSLWPVKDWREIVYWVGTLRPTQVFIAGEPKLTT